MTIDACNQLQAARDAGLSVDHMRALSIKPESWYENLVWTLTKSIASLHVVAKVLTLHMFNFELSQSTYMPGAGFECDDPDDDSGDVQRTLDMMGPDMSLFMMLDSVGTLVNATVVNEIPWRLLMTNYNCFRVPIHFADNRFTFKKFAPPSP